MDDSFLVRDFERERNLPCNRKRVRQRQPTPVNPLGQCVARYQLEDERLDAIALFNPVDRRDIGMIERRQHRNNFV